MIVAIERFDEPGKSDLDARYARAVDVHPIVNMNTSEDERRSVLDTLSRAPM